MFKKAISTIQPLTVFMATAALLIGCSKGGNVPKDWDKDGVGSSRLKLQCASPNTFSAQAVNTFRSEKLAQMKSLNMDQNAGAQNALLVIRTILVDLPNYKQGDQLPSENLLLLPQQQGSMSEHETSGQLIIAEKVDCHGAIPTAQYQGPGVNGKMIAKLKSISEKSIEMEATDAAGVLTTVKVEKTTVNRKKDPAGFQKAQQREDNGFTELTVTISRKLNGKDLTGAVIIQKTVMNMDEEISVNQSVINLMTGVAGAANIPPAFRKKLNAAQAQAAGLKEVNTDNVTLTFSELLALKKSVVEAQPLDEVNVTSNKVPPAIMIDEVKEQGAAGDAAATTTPAPIPTPAAAPAASTVPADAQFPIINPNLSQDSFLQNYLKGVIKNAQTEEKADDAAASEAQEKIEADEAADEESETSAVESNDAGTPEAQKTQDTKPAVAATGKIISV